jgi:polar amino acid transport system substrate-binding protein
MMMPVWNSHRDVQIPTEPSMIISRRIMKVLICVSALALLILTATAGAAEDIRLLTYYSDPPYGIKESNSETVALANWLSRKSEGRYRFRAEYLPRLRLDNVMREECVNAVTAWVSPVFFDYARNQEYIWSKAVILDTDVVVSNKKKPVDYEGPDSLDGYKLGGIRGHQYISLDANLKSGKLQREDAENEAQNLSKLKLGRVDVVFLQYSGLASLKKRFPDLNNWMYIAPKPRQMVERRLFSCNKNPEVMRFIDSMICKYHPRLKQEAGYLQHICKPALKF